MAALASLANTAGGARALANMVKSNPDGSYVVTFPGDQKNPITVTEDDVRDYNPQSPMAWGKVIEAGFLKYNNVEKPGDKTPPRPLKVTRSDVSLQLLTEQTLPWPLPSTPIPTLVAWPRKSWPAV